MSIDSKLWKAIGGQLHHPNGIAGRLAGHAMAWANRQPNRTAIDALKMAPADTVLELGPGPGRSIGILESMVPHGRVLGIDHSRAMLDQAARYNRRAIRMGRVKLRQGRFDALPWDSDTVDKILAVNVIYFFVQMLPKFAKRVAYCVPAVREHTHTLLAAGREFQEP
jgi:trans-aconitate methyltransferase